MTVRRNRARLIIAKSARCEVCFHSRSTHNPLLMQGSCRMAGCMCTQFEPICGCGHLLSWHRFGTPPDPFSCDRCRCQHFGAVNDLATSDMGKQMTLFE